LSEPGQRAYHTAVRLLGRREHSVTELRNKLRQKHRDLDQSTLERLLETLQQDRLLSDERFAETLIRGRLNRGYGPVYIQQELNSKGIDPELAETLLEQAKEENALDWLTLARELVERRHPNAGEDSASWHKAARFLARRGFSSNHVIRALGDRPYD
jgi:regulatory protein